jgi:hypothetical protein
MFILFKIVPCTFLSYQQRIPHKNKTCWRIETETYSANVGKNAGDGQAG